MKKLLLIVLVLIVLLLTVFYLYSKTKRPVTSDRLINPSLSSAINTVASVSPTTDSRKPITKFEDVTYKNQTYRVYYAVVESPIKIIPNVTDKKSASTLFSENNCQSGINGGFYTKENTYLGLLKVDGKELSPLIPKSNLVNGFLSFDNNDNATISSSFADDALNVIQTGPLLYNRELDTTDTDKQARRMVAVQDENGKLAFLAVTLKDDQNFGPTLQYLPKIVYSLSKPFKPNKAINLDGGSASYFSNGEIELSEFSPVGSLLCIL